MIPLKIGAVPHSDERYITKLKFFKLRYMDVPAEGRTFLRTLGAQRASVRESVKNNLFSKWHWFEKHREAEHVYVSCA